jgi:hypothetical protein
MSTKIFVCRNGLLWLSRMGSGPAITLAGAALSFEVPLTMDPTQLVYEYACHEGNYGLINILSGARAQDRAEVRAQPNR